jgi:glycosyltransferase involved in cell wall biosynthesis
VKILYHHRIASKDGQFVHIEEITKQLIKQGHEIIMVAPEVAQSSDFGSDGGWVSKLRSKLPAFVAELLEFIYCFYDFFKLVKAIVKHKPDCIYERCNLYLPSGVWAKKLFKLPFILEVNSPLYIERSEYSGISIGWLAKWSECYVWKQADLTLPVTKVLAGYLIDAGVEYDKISVTHNGVDPDVFTKQNANNRDEKYKNKLVIGFVGFCREWHKLDQVMTLLAQSKRTDLFFLLVGDGPVIDELKDQAKQLNFDDNFEATGLVSRKEMPYWLDQMDIALQPAVTPWASPLKMMEYFAKGLAIVAPDSANIKELISDNDNGMLFDANNLDDMIAKLEKLIVDKVLSESISKNSYNTIPNKCLLWNENALKIINEFEKLKKV